MDIILFPFVTYSVFFLSHLAHQASGLTVNGHWKNGEIGVEKFFPLGLRGRRIRGTRGLALHEFRGSIQSPRDEATPRKKRRRRWPPGFHVGWEHSRLEKVLVLRGAELFLHPSDDVPFTSLIFPPRVPSPIRKCFLTKPQMTLLSITIWIYLIIPYE